MVDKNQLRMEWQGNIIVFTDKQTKAKWSSQPRYIWSVMFKKRKFYYAGEYKPLPVGRPRKIIL